MHELEWTQPFILCFHGFLTEQTQVIKIWFTITFLFLHQALWFDLHLIPLIEKIQIYGHTKRVWLRNKEVNIWIRPISIPLIWPDGKDLVAICSPNHGFQNTSVVSTSLILSASRWLNALTIDAAKIYFFDASFQYVYVTFNASSAIFL